MHRLGVHARPAVPVRVAALIENQNFLAVPPRTDPLTDGPLALPAGVHVPGIQERPAALDVPVQERERERQILGGADHRADGEVRDRAGNVGYRDVLHGNSSPDMLVLRHACPYTLIEVQEFCHGDAELTRCDYAAIH